MSIDKLNHKMHYNGLDPLNLQNNSINDNNNTSYNYNPNHHLNPSFQPPLPFIREPPQKRSLAGLPGIYSINIDNNNLPPLLIHGSPNIPQLNIPKERVPLTGIRQLNLPISPSTYNNETYTIQTKAPKLQYGSSANRNLNNFNTLPPINNSYYNFKPDINNNFYLNEHIPLPKISEINHNNNFTNTLNVNNNFNFPPPLSITPVDGFNIKAPNQSPLTEYKHMIPTAPLEYNNLIIPPIQNNSTNINNYNYIDNNTVNNNIINNNNEVEDNEIVSYDDKDGHIVIQKDLVIANRYKVESLLGQGTFGRVAKCFDKISLRKVAIKVVRAVPKYREAAKIEMRVLNTLKKNDPLNLNKCIHMIENFEFKNHICMSFDLYGPSLFDFLKANQFQGFPFPHIQLFTKQLLNSIAYVHGLGLVHTDLKPENILLVDGDYNEVKRKGSKVKNILKNTEIKLIDFGSATFDNEFHSSVVSTRHYRAPEIILGMGWSYPCDLWSVGCIIIELISGDAMFQTHDNVEHLAMMEKCLGKIPKEMYHKSSNTGKGYFKSPEELDYPNDATTKQSLKNVNAIKSIQKTVNRKGQLGEYLVDLINKLLTYKPEDRITAVQALKHPFFNLNLGLDGRLKRIKETSTPNINSN